MIRHVNYFRRANMNDHGNGDLLNSCVPSARHSNRQLRVTSNIVFASHFQNLYGAPTNVEGNILIFLSLRLFADSTAISLLTSCVN